jgi:hypothetical protein
MAALSGNTPIDRIILRHLALLLVQKMIWTVLIWHWVSAQGCMQLSGEEMPDCLAMIAKCQSKVHRQSAGHHLELKAIKLGGKPLK